jgi:hypothetical protein
MRGIKLKLKLPNCSLLSVEGTYQEIGLHLLLENLKSTPSLSEAV